MPTKKHPTWGAHNNANGTTSRPTRYLAGADTRGKLVVHGLHYHICNRANKGTNDKGNIAPVKAAFAKNILNRSRFRAIR